MSVLIQNGMEDNTNTPNSETKTDEEVLADARQVTRQVGATAERAAALVPMLSPEGDFMLATTAEADDIRNRRH